MLVGERVYRYLGEVHNGVEGCRPELVGQLCVAVVDSRNKCIRSRMGTMLVRFERAGPAVVKAVRLRKVAS